MTETLASRQNPLIQQMRALQNAKTRRETGTFLLEGANSVGAALDAKWPLREIVATPGDTQLTARIQNRGFQITRATPEILAYACDSQNAQIAAIGEIPRAQNDFDLSGLLLIIDGASDPGNVGTLLRAADAAGVEKVVLTEGSADIWSPKAVRSAAGSLFSISILNLENRAPDAICEVLKLKNIALISAQAHGGTSCFEFDWPSRAALILGHETRGISEVFASNSRAVTIPIWGRAESLNVAMAGTLLMYARQVCLQRTNFT